VNEDHFRATKEGSNLGQALLMVGFAIPLDLMAELAAKDQYPAIQGHNHQWAIIRGIEKAAGRSMDLLSFAGISDYPRHPCLYCSGGRWQHAPKARDVWLPFVNVFPLKLLGRFVVMALAISSWLWRNRKSKHRIVFLYATQCSQLYAMLLATLLIHARKFVIMTDPPSVDLKGEGRLLWLARRMDRQLQRLALPRVDGLIVLAEPLATDYAPGVPYEVVEGIAPDIGSSDPAVDFQQSGSMRASSCSIMYAGTLNAEYGVALLLDSLPFLPKNVELWIFGKGPFESEVRARAAEDPRVKYFGFCPNEEVRRMARQATALINPRPSNGWFTRYSFPSKLLEYLSSGSVVMSTRLKTIPREYEPYVIWIDDETPRGIAQAVQVLQEMDERQRSELGAAGARFVQTQKSEPIQGVRIWRFVTNVIGCDRCNGGERHA